MELQSEHYEESKKKQLQRWIKAFFHNIGGAARAGRQQDS